ncbi:Glycosyl transferase family 13 [Trinorchestia longiramus]|nr:Glycosyl transferase family 13 [Trinorchestia longiramus]
MDTSASLVIFVIFLSLYYACLGRHVDVEVLSSRERLIVTVQTDQANVGGKVALGLHMLVLNQHSGAVILRRAFNSTEYAEGLALYPVLTSIAEGRIVIFGILTEASLNLARVTRRLLLSVGVHSAAAVNYRGYLACVVTMAGHTHADAVVLDDHTQVLDTYASPVMMHTQVPLHDSEACAWMLGDEPRRMFCSNYAGYGDLCDCDAPLPIDFPPMKAIVPLNCTVQISEISPRTAWGIPRTDPSYSRWRSFGSLPSFGLTPPLDDVEITKFNDTRSFYAHRISSHYRISLVDLFAIHPLAPAVIILEEDLIAAPDFYSFFNQTAFLLSKDPSLYCISAWNDHGALHTSRDVGQLIRVETMVGNGWMLSRKIYEEIAEKWKASVSWGDWDLWLRTDRNAAQRECVVPSVSRVFHYGLTGAHVKGIMTHVHFAGHLVTAVPHVALRDVEKLMQQEYERQIYELLQGDQVVFLNSTLSPCHRYFLPQNVSKTVVVFFKMSQRLDHSSWALIASCLGVWHLDTRGHHRGLIRLGFYNTTLLAIGYPFSDYSYLKPAGVQVLEATTDVQQLGKVAMDNRRRHRVFDLEKFMPNLMLDARGSARAVPGQGQGSARPGPGQGQGSARPGPWQRQGSIRAGPGQRQARARAAPGQYQGQGQSSARPGPGPGPAQRQG